MWTVGVDPDRGIAGTKDDDMTTRVMVADWIKRVVDAERARDAVRAGENEAIARRAEFVRAAAHRLLEDLRATVTRDVEAFREEFAGDPGRAVVAEAAALADGIVVRKPAPRATSLTVTPQLHAGAIACHYQFFATDGRPPREERIEVSVVGDGHAPPQVKLHGTGQVFATTDALSEFLLVPVLTGRPR
jgi:hypothetical protein